MTKPEVGIIDKLPWREQRTGWENKRISSQRESVDCVRRGDGRSSRLPGVNLFLRDEAGRRHGQQDRRPEVRCWRQCRRIARCRDRLLTAYFTEHWQFDRDETSRAEENRPLPKG